MEIERQVGIVILAAGNGTRMNSDVPKVMHKLRNKPLIEHVVENVESSQCCSKPVVVVCDDHTFVQDHLGDRADYAVQHEQHGTGHATACAEELLKDRVDHVIVLYGDMPFLRPESIQRLVGRHAERDNTVTIMTVTVPNFDGKYAPFYGFGRIVRRESDGHVLKDVEKKDCTEEQLGIRELNSGFYCYKAPWLWDHLKKLKNDNSQGEYYLTDLVHMAVEEGEPLSSVAIDPHEAVGVNTQEDLKLAQDVA